MLEKIFAKGASGTVGKYGAGGLGIVIAAIAAFFGWQYLQYRGSDDFRAMQIIKEWERKYAEDTYGGDTPEETLRLFISALKNGDLELASKYFVVDEQETWREDLSKIKEKGLLDEMIRDLEREKFRNQISDGQISFDIANDQKEAILNILLAKGSNGKWKIVDL